MQLTPKEQVVYRQLRDLLSSELWQVEIEKLTLDFDVFHQVFEVDSLDMAELAAAIEVRMGVHVEDREIREVRSILDLVKLVASKQGS